MSDINISKISIISNNAELSEKITAHFRRNNQYIPIFDIIYGDVPDTTSMAYGELKNECIRVSNSINLLNSTKVLLIDCKEGVKNIIKSIIKSKLIIELSKYDIKQLAALPGFNETPYNFELFNSNKQRKSLIIVEDDDNQVSKVIARNLAISECATLLEIPAVTKETTDRIRDLFYNWMNSDENGIRQKSKEDIFDFIVNQVDIGKLESRKKIIFITRGIPYGFYPFQFPTTHIFIHRSLGLQIVRGMIKSNSTQMQSVAAYICDPSELQNTESEELSNIFHGKKYVVKQSLGKRATVRDVSNSSKYLPVDFIFYSTHCRATEGYPFCEPHLSDWLKNV